MFPLHPVENRDFACWGLPVPPSPRKERPMRMELCRECKTYHPVGCHSNGGAPAPPPDTVSVPRELVEDAAKMYDTNATTYGVLSARAAELRALLGPKGGQ